MKKFFISPKSIEERKAVQAMAFALGWNWVNGKLEYQESAINRAIGFEREDVKKLIVWDTPLWLRSHDYHEVISIDELLSFLSEPPKPQLPPPVTVASFTMHWTRNGGLERTFTQGGVSGTINIMPKEIDAIAATSRKIRGIEEEKELTVREVCEWIKRNRGADTDHVRLMGDGSGSMVNCGGINRPHMPNWDTVAKLTSIVRSK